MGSRGAPSAAVRRLPNHLQQHAVSRPDAGADRIICRIAVPEEPHSAVDGGSGVRVVEEETPSRPESSAQAAYHQVGAHLHISNTLNLDCASSMCKHRGTSAQCIIAPVHRCSIESHTPFTLHLLRPCALRASLSAKV